jgi:Asp-tRNA(Asn)/Glu-tRNA(Gln) amidotransferase A subunit family amidase
MTGLELLEMRFAVHESDVHAFVDEPDRFARLRRELAQVDEQTRSGVVRPLAGLPLGVKDIFRVDGFETRAGSQLPPEELAGDEAEAVTALRAAGALVVGKTHTTEFAYFVPGPTRNPKALDRTPGGSSSGSAAAVAAGLCELALGTQTIGSIGRPAAYCGVVGFKPSYERISRAGVIPLAPSVDHVGLLAADVATVARALPVLIHDWRGSVETSRRGRLGVPIGPYLERVSREGREHFETVRAELGRAGWEVVEVEAMSDARAIDSRHRLLVAAEAAEVHAAWYSRHAALYGGKTEELIRRGQGVTHQELAELRAGCAKLRGELDALVEQHALDAWISPPAQGPAPKGLESTGDPMMNLPWTHAGVPALVLPAGTIGEGLPMGLQIATRFGADEELLALGREIEAALAEWLRASSPGGSQ